MDNQDFQINKGGERRRRLRRFIPPLALCALILGYEALIWRSLIGYVSTFNDTGVLFVDFKAVYLGMASEILKTGRPIFMYFYSAFFALLCVPFTWLSGPVAATLWGALQGLTLLGVCLAARRLIRLSEPGLIFFAGLCLAGTPILSNFAWGQVSLLLTLCVLASFQAHTTDHPVAAGALLAFATSIKYYTLIFVLYFLFKRDRRALIAFAAAFVLFFVALPMAFLGPARWMDFHRIIASGLTAFEPAVSQSPNSQYVGHLAKRFVEGLYVLDLSGLSLPRAASVLGLLVFGVNALAVRALIRRRVEGEAALAAATLFTSLPFLIGTSWPHYFVYLPFCQVLLLRRLWPLARGGRARFSFAFAVGSVVLSSVFFFRLFRAEAVYCSLGAYFFANLLVMPGCYRFAFGRVEGAGGLDLKVGVDET